MSGQAGFFDVEERLKRLSDLGDRLEALVRVVDFEIFRFELVKALSYSNLCGFWGLAYPPDARTIWLFREKLTKVGTIQALFERFESAFRASGYIAMGGRIVDASLVVRTVGIARATMKIGMTNIVYNAKRLICLQKAAMA